ncbi:MAG: type II toxin-antitoxin system Phd/YefM family antitoxin [Coraliomargarita sp.]|nr:type II toxin-antitoxin system Phd/YefM family antitoxin [Coraliomargarita sp.]
MDPVKASYFENHFGAVFDRVGKRAIRIERRGRKPAVLTFEAGYRALQQDSLRTPARESAMRRVRVLASRQPVDLNKLKEGPRAASILSKHGGGTDS